MSDSQRARSATFYFAGIVMLLAAGAAVGYFHWTHNQEVAIARDARESTAERGPRIDIVKIEQGPSERSIRLLGDVRASSTTTLYAKVPGYIKTVLADKGDRIEEGQLLAEITAPELDQQYAAASADLANKQRNLSRIRDLFTRGNTTEVAKLQAETDATVAENNVAALATMKDYQAVRAPYAGHIIQRYVDPGAFITSGQTTFVSATPIVTIADDTRVKVYLYLQQVDVPSVHIGDFVELADAERPERTRTAAISRMNGELDVKSHTMLAEVNVDNSDGFFVPGSFAYVTLRVGVTSYPQIPVTALLTRGSDNFVAVFENEHVHMKRVKVASTDGSIVSLSDGVKAGQQVAINVPDEVTDGSRIQPVFEAPSGQSAQTNASR